MYMNVCNDAHLTKLIPFTYLISEQARYLIQELTFY